MSRMKASLTDTSSSVTSSDEDDDQGGRQEDDQKGELDRHAGGLILSPKAGGLVKSCLLISRTHPLQFTQMLLLIQMILINFDIFLFW